MSASAQSAGRPGFFTWIGAMNRSPVTSTPSVRIAVEAPGSSTDSRYTSGIISVLDVMGSPM